MSLWNSVAPPKLLSHWKALNFACSNPGCAHQSPLNNFGKKHERFQIGRNHYCSADCFESAAQKELAELCRLEIPAEHFRRFRVPLGLVLLSRGAIENDQLQAALTEQRAHGGRIGDILSRLGYATEDQVTLAAAAQSGHPVFSVQNWAAGNEIEIPLSLLESHSVLPLLYSRGSNKLMIGFVHQVDPSLLHSIEQITEAIAVPCFVTPSDFRARIRSLASVFRNEEVVFDRVSSALEMARIGRSYAVQIGANLARFTRCRTHVWARVEGRREKIYLLFKFSGR